MRRTVLVTCALVLASCGGSARDGGRSTAGTAPGAGPGIPLVATSVAPAIPTVGTVPRTTVVPSSTVASGTGPGRCAVGKTKGEVNVLAASSLSNILEEARGAFEKSHPCVTRLNISYGSSGMFAAQIVAGSPADVFLSASESTMETVRSAGLVTGEPRLFLRNRGMIMVSPRSGYSLSVRGVGDLLDSANPGIKVGLCVASAPCGALANTVLRNAQKAAAQGDLVRSAVADTEAPNVEDLVTKIQIGELDAGIVYESDCAYARPRGLATCVEIPAGINSTNSYLVAALNSRGNSADFVAFVTSSYLSALATVKYGFLSP